MTDGAASPGVAASAPVTYTAGYRVRFDEAGPAGALRASGLLRYTQDLAARHSEALGYDRAWYAARGITWLVRCAEIEVARPIAYGSALEATTRVVGFRRVWSRRETTFVLPDGARAATVRIDWVLVDGSSRPARIPNEIEALFGAGRAEGLALGRVAVGAPPPDAARTSFTVRPQELDPMGHVNNGVYADWVDEAVTAAAGSADPVRAVPRLVRLEYALPAEPGAALTSVCWADAGGWSVLVGGSIARSELLRARVEPHGPPPRARAGHAVG